MDSISRFRELTLRKRQLTKELKDLQREINEVERDALKEMTDNGVSKMTVDGYTIFTQKRFYGNGSIPELAEAMEGDPHLESLVEKKINRMKLNALAKEFWNEETLDFDVPDILEGKFKPVYVDKLQVRRS